MTQIEATQSYLGIGAFRSQENRDLLLMGEQVVDDYATRLNLYKVFRYRVNDHVKLLNMLYYQPAASELSDGRLLQQRAVRVVLNNSLPLGVIARCDA